MDRQESRLQVSVNEEMLSYGEMQAEITLKQGDMEKVIAKLTRQEKAYG